VVLTKAELLDPEDVAERLEALAAHGRSAQALPTLDAPVAISAATRQGLDALLAVVWRELGVVRPDEPTGSKAVQPAPAAPEEHIVLVPLAGRDLVRRPPAPRPSEPIDPPQHPLNIKNP